MPREPTCSLKLKNTIRQEREESGEEEEVVGWREGEEVVVVDVGAATNQTLHSEFRPAEGHINIGGGELTHKENLRILLHRQTPHLLSPKII